MRDHRESYRNLDPQREFSNGDIFTKKRPGDPRPARQSDVGPRRLPRRVDRVEKTRAGLNGAHW